METNPVVDNAQQVASIAPPVSNPQPQSNSNFLRIAVALFLVIVLVGATYIFIGFKKTPNSTAPSDTNVTAPTIKQLAEYKAGPQGPNGQDAQRRNIMIEIQSGATRYKSIKGTWPTSIQEIVNINELIPRVINDAATMKVTYEYVDQETGCSIKGTFSNGDTYELKCSDTSINQPR